jgi:RNA polymerase sigma-70 factor (ECF subfamily)
MARRAVDRDPVVMITATDRNSHPSNGLGVRGTIDAESQAWIDRLTPGSDDLEAGIEDLHALLLRAARFEVGRRRAALPHLWGDDLDDLAQQSADDALLAVLRKLEDFRGESHFTTWAYKFALLETAATVRSRAWQGREVPTEPDWWTRSAACGPTAQEDLEMKDLLAALKAAMATELTAGQREVLVAVALNDVPIDVLATRMGRTRGAVYKTLHDARRKLRTAVAAREGALGRCPPPEGRIVPLRAGKPVPGGRRGHGRRSLRAGTVIATPSAIDEILRLRARYHLVALRHTEERGAPRSVSEAKLPAGLNDLQLGEIGGVPFLIDADRYKGWGCPNLVVDLPQGGGGSAADDAADRVTLTLRSSR